MKTAICGRVVTPYGVVDNGMVCVENGRITAVGEKDEEAISQIAQVHHYPNQYIVPGFIDIHCHGGASGMCYEGDPAEFAAHHLKFGTTSILPTFSYNQSHEEIIAALSSVQKAMEAEHSTILGIHMEGPYINPKYGAITAPIRKVNPQEYQEILQLAGKQIRLWTLAPELEGQQKFMQTASEYGIVFSVGHSEATPETIFAGYQYGLRLGCHLTNASGVTPNVPRYGGTREVGVHEAVLLHDDMYAEVIPDENGIHVRPLMLRLIVKTKGVDRVIIITDATGYSGADGLDVRFKERNEFSPGGKDKLLSGSLLTMDRAVRNMMNHTGIGIVDACKMASLNPARLLGVDKDIGSIQIGKKANLLVVNDRIDIKSIMLQGKIVHQFSKYDHKDGE